MSLHIEVLTREFKRRVDKNERYSMRAYANFLGLHPSALSRVLAGKWDLTSSSGVRLAKKLQLSLDERRRFVRSILDARTSKEASRVGEMIESPELRPVPKKITNDLYAKIARLKSLALLELTFTNGFRSSYDWIAKALDMRIDEVRELVEVLLEVGMLKRNGEDLVNSNEHMTAVESEETNEIRRKLQMEIREASRDSIVKTNFDERAHFGMTMAIDPAKLPVARQKIMAFIETLSDDLETGDRTRVYQLAVCLFPLSRSMENS